MSRGRWAPKKPRWFAISAVLTAVTLAIYLALAWVRPWLPGRAGGLVFGTIAALLFLNGGLYPARRRWHARPWKTAQRWLQFHIYGSLLGTWFVFIHMNFRWPAGQLGWWLFGLSMWVTATGLFGVVLQKGLPVAMSRGLNVEAIYERIPELTARLVAKADAAAQGAAESLERLYASAVRPMLLVASPRLAYLRSPRDECDRCLAPLQDLTTFVSGADRDRLSTLQAIVREKLELDAHLTFQRALRVWLILHVPAAFALLGLLAVHIVAVVMF